MATGVNRKNNDTTTNLSHDAYRLRVENLPKVPPKPRQIEREGRVLRVIVNRTALPARAGALYFDGKMGKGIPPGSGTSRSGPRHLPHVPPRDRLPSLRPRDRS
jgi:hypothetical protein